MDRVRRNVAWLTDGLFEEKCTGKFDTDISDVNMPDA